MRAILSRFPNSVRVGSGVMGLASRYGPKIAAWFPASTALRDARFFLMLPCDGGCWFVDRTTTTGDGICPPPIVVADDDVDDDDAADDAVSACESGVRVRGTVELYEEEGSVGARGRLTLNGIDGIDGPKRFWLGWCESPANSACARAAGTKGGMLLVTGMPARDGVFSLAERPFALTKAAERRWCGFRS